MRGLLLLATVAPVAASPVQKVIKLLSNLEVKVEEEGKTEAATYDKYACFCKDQASNKQYAIEQSQEKIETLDARLAVLDTKIADQTAAIESLDKAIGVEVAFKATDDVGEHVSAETIQTQGKEVTARDGNFGTGLSGRINYRTALREQREREFRAMDDEHVRAIDAIKRAIVALQSTGGVSLVQLNEYRQLASSLLQQTPTGAGHAPVFEYSSKEIIAVLQGLLKTFKGARQDDHSTNQSEKETDEQLSNELTREKQFKSEEREARATTLAKLEKEHGIKTADHEVETADQTADKAFLKELTKTCEDKATNYDSRSKARMDELTALSQAITELKSKSGKYASTNLAMAQTSSEDDSESDNDDMSYLADDAEEEEEAADELNAGADDEEEPESFLQVDSRSVQERNVIKMIADKAKLLKSPALAALSVRMQQDHFVKVRGLIKDLVERLVAEKAAEADKQAQCETDMNREMKSRDDSQAAMETEQGNIAEEKATIATLKAEIAELKDAVAALNKALLEATELRAAEKEANETTIKDAGEGKASVEEAIKILNKIYAFVQQSPNDRTTDREGNSIADLAGSGIEENEDYRVAEEGTGIVGILNVIATDYERTVTQTQDAEDAAQSEFETYEKDTNDDIDAKEKSIDTKSGEKDDSEGRLQDAQDELEKQTELNDIANKALAVLKKSCVDTEISYEERVKRREQEIQSLKEALKILEGMSFLQKRK